MWFCHYLLVFNILFLIQFYRMATYQLSSYIYLDTYNECYKKIVIINQNPGNPLQTLVKRIPNRKPSAFKGNSNCCPVPSCIFAILNPMDTSTLLCVQDIANLFSFLSTNGYTIQHDLTKMMQDSTEKIDKLICYISKN